MSGRNTGVHYAVTGSNLHSSEIRRSHAPTFLWRTSSRPALPCWCRRRNRPEYDSLQTTAEHPHAPVRALHLLPARGRASDDVWIDSQPAELLMGAWAVFLVSSPSVHTKERR